MSEKTKDVIEWIYCIVIAVAVALLFKYFIFTPTVVKQRSMYPTLQSDQRLALNRTFRIVKQELEIGDIVTFEAPTHIYNKWEVDESNPVALYEYTPKGLFNKFAYYVLEITKTSYIKRVIALEGDHVKIENGKVFVNGEELIEDYLPADTITESDVFSDFIVPEGYFFAMGDNRSNSTDCRVLGCIPYEKLEGIVMFRFWPITTFGSVK